MKCATTKTSAALALLAALTAPAAARAQQTPLGAPLERAGFERLERRHGVTVYVHKQARELHFAAEAELAAPPREVLDALLAYERQVGYIGRLTESRVLRRGPGSLQVYQRLDMPVIDDRDYTLQARWGARGADLWLTFRALRRGPAARAGVVRVTHHGGSWQLRPIRGGRATFVRYQMLMDLAGWVPLWLARRSAGKEVAQVFVEFSRMMAADRARRPPRSAGPRGSARPPARPDRGRAGSR